MENIIYLIPILPLFGFLICGIFGSKMPKKVVGIIANLAVWIPFFLSVYLFSTFTEPIKASLFNWFTVDHLHVSFSFQIDQLSLIMMMIVTGIGSLIHLYSIGYMHEDKGFYK